jgi:hypothetical protein
LANALQDEIALYDLGLPISQVKPGKSSTIGDFLTAVAMKTNEP